MILNILVWIFASSSDLGLVVYGPNTPEPLKKLFRNTDLHFLSSNDDISKIILINPLSIIYDITLDQRSFLYLDLISEISNVPYLTISKPTQSIFSKYRFYLLQTLKDESQGMINLIKFFEWDELTIIGLNSFENMQKYNFIKSDLNIRIENYFYGFNSSEVNMRLFLRKVLKSNPVKYLLVLDEGASLELCLKIIKEENISKYGSYFIF